ncbi:MAG TPA: hypothetical protein VNO70_03825 [Blastocatellia bacterium]|nr:hypothetical protein [Blastocatellia bacterium]
MTFRNLLSTRATSVVVSLIFILSCATFVRAQSGDIRKIDFHNYTYRPGCLEGDAPVTVKDGEFTRGKVDDPDSNYIYFAAGEVVYGDLTGDGQEEAVVETLCNTGGTGQFTDGIIFTMKDGKPVEIGTLGVGDRAYGGIAEIAIENGLLKVGRYGTESGGACCPEYIETATYRLSGNKLIEVGKPTRKKVQQEEEQPASEAKRIRFQRERTTAVLTGATDSSVAYILGARAGQKMFVHLTSKSGNAEVMVQGADGAALQGESRPEDWSGTLPKTGDYRITVISTGGKTVYTLEVTIR